ncbi:LLM class flavin-dependent oxidoreductase [Streptomyces wuyuanensis]|uniref:LLM class flavin-dependent oxidoreductase n=1 Tax=Streptomyces wuyuanensis TaxID=1196353 RepID=UPI0037AA2356
MADYGHELLFGTFLTPQSRDAAAVVDLAVLSERSGLDLVTFQDHPYQSGFLDTWTLLSWVAARTERVRLSGNVINLPLRPPAVLARAAASLDLLSGGRVELGLGAGAFWDAIEAMGGRRLTASEAVGALDEAIDVIRGVWDADERAPLRVRGDFHRVDGARRGPAPAHPVPIWVGAYKPRMLRLTGRKADGWLPTLNFLKDPDLRRGNAIIDEEARRTGRDPRAIRRLLNIMHGPGQDPGPLQGPPERWAERLLPFVLEHGVGTFVLGTDDPRAIAAFGEVVAPALREAVAEERGGTSADTSRPAVGHSGRAGAGADPVPVSLRARAVRPGDSAYEKVRSTYLWPGSPALVLRPGTPREVSEALVFARGQGVPIAVRSGGHGLSGRATNDGGIVVSLADLDRVEVIDRQRRLVRVGAGARWGDVAEALAPHGLAISSGDYGDVGVGGLATTAGVGLLARSYGLTIDHVKGADAVLADGRIVRADAEHHPDLFWALRGAGGNMAVVTSLDIEAAEVGDVVLGTFLHAPADLDGFLRRWGRTVEDAPRELTAFLSVARRQGRYVAQTSAVWAGTDVDGASAALQPFLGLAPVLHRRAELVPYAAVVAPAHNDHHGRGPVHSRSALVRHLDVPTTSTVARLFDDRAIAHLQIRSVGGAVNDTPAAATAYAHRFQNFSLNAVVREGREEQTDALWDGLGEGLYLSFDTRIGPHVLSRAFPPATLRRLRDVKAVYDPGNAFRSNFPIPPADRAS